MHIFRSVTNQQNVTKSTTKPQLINDEGKKSREISLLKKRQFNNSSLTQIIRYSLCGKQYPSLKPFFQIKEMPLHQLDPYIESLRNIENPNHAQILDICRSLFSVLHSEEFGEDFDFYWSLLKKLMAHSISFFKQTEEQALDKTLSPRDKYRALTNYWANITIICLLRDDDFAPGDDAYAYSYLYPYTDNIMDMLRMPQDHVDQSVPLNNVKQHVVKNIQEQLETRKMPINMAFEGGKEERQGELRVYELIDMIVRNIDVPSKSGLIDSMKIINYAQYHSLKQECLFDDMQTEYQALSKKKKKEIFDITVFKGAAAVIPNAYMTIPNLNREQANLAAIIGYVTQFVNDIDGIEEDLKEKRFTPANMAYLKYGNIDKYIVRLLSTIKSLKCDISRYTNVSKSKISILSDVFLTSVKNRVIYAHSRSPNGLLSSTLIQIVEKQLGGKLDLMSNVVRFHKDLFGGFSEYEIGFDDFSSRSSLENTSSMLDREEKLSDPKRFQDFLANFLQEMKKTWND